jgi:hypothetical protein
MSNGRDFEDLYAGGGVANPVQGKPYTGFGLTAAQKDALNAVPAIDAVTSTEAERAEALEEVVAALKS